MLHPHQLADTIAAIATPSGVGGIAVLRVSGNDAIENVNKIFSKKNLQNQKGYTAHFGKIVNPFSSKNEIIDEVIITIFKNPNSYTGEDVVEISCHGSVFIQQKILQALLQTGCRLAFPGEFTQRAFLNGKMDLAQAEAVADLIASSNQASHQLAMQQLKGGYSDELKKLRERLIWFASLIELELDFSQEDVEFANRKQMNDLVEELQQKITPLIQSFELGNAIKNGVPVAIVGKPNAGKSTLLNVLLNEQRAIVSEIAGTTRDTIEEIVNINGIQFRLIDTAGLRDATDSIEKIGVEKSKEKIEQAQIVLYLFAINEMNEEELKNEMEQLKIPTSKLLLVANKMDVGVASFQNKKLPFPLLKISAAKNQGIDELKNSLFVKATNGKQLGDDIVISNQRHLQNLQTTLAILNEVKSGIENETASDLLAFHLRHALQALGEITGTINNETLLDTIFSKFCIGK